MKYTQDAQWANSDLLWCSSFQVAPSSYTKPWSCVLVNNMFFIFYISRLNALLLAEILRQDQNFRNTARVFYSFKK